VDNSFKKRYHIKSRGGGAAPGEMSKKQSRTASYFIITGLPGCDKAFAVVSQNGREEMDGISHR
jgi:hypothetical protein